MSLDLSYGNEWISRNPDVLGIAYPNGAPNDPTELVRGAINASRELLPLYDNENSSFSSVEIGKKNEVGANCLARSGLLHCILSPFQQITPRIVHNRSLIFDVPHQYNIVRTTSGSIIIVDNSVSYENSRNDTDPGLGTFTFSTIDPLEDETAAKNRTDRRSQVFGRIHHARAERTHNIYSHILKGGKTIIIDPPTEEEIVENRKQYNLEKVKNYPGPFKALYLGQTTIYSRKSSNKLADKLSRSI